MSIIKKLIEETERGGDPISLLWNTNPEDLSFSDIAELVKILKATPAKAIYKLAYLQLEVNCYLRRHRQVLRKIIEKELKEGD